jgi:hypothetical protein
VFTITITITVTHTVSALGTEVAGARRLSGGEIATATRAVDDVPERGTSSEGRSERKHSAGNPASGDELLSVECDCLFDSVVFLSHVRHPFGSCVSRDYCLSRVLTFPVRFLCFV